MKRLSRFLPHINFFFACLLAFGIVKLWFNGQLSSYIHPDTIILTAFGSAALLATCLLTAMKPVHRHTTAWQTISLVGIASIILFGKVMPLSSNIVEKRSTESAAPIASRSAINLNKQTENFSILEWNAAWESDPTHLKYDKKAVKMVGFMTYKADKPYIARLMMTCCVIDAMPIQLPLETTVALPAADTWVAIKGVTENRDGALYILVTSMQLTEIPTNPYVY